MIILIGSALSFIWWLIKEAIKEEEHRGSREDEEDETKCPYCGGTLRETKNNPRYSVMCTSCRYGLDKRDKEILFP